MPTPVIIESPYAGKNPTHFRRNIQYLHAAIQDCLRRGEIPYASHNFYPGALDDNIPEQRKQGIEAGFATAEVFKVVGGHRAFYNDRGTSTGMNYGRDHAERIGQLYISRTLGEEWAVENDPPHCDHLGVEEPHVNDPYADYSPQCTVCGMEFETVTLPKDAIEVALDYLKKKA